MLKNQPLGLGFRLSLSGLVLGFGPFWSGGLGLGSVMRPLVSESLESLDPRMWALVLSLRLCFP